VRSGVSGTGCYESVSGKAAIVKVKRWDEMGCDVKEDKDNSPRRDVGGFNVNGS
jgi:hypothetical protein